VTLSVQQNGTERRLRVGLISLGCAKNLADAEIMLGTLLKDGVEVVNDASQADAVIVNTCSFIDSAQQESVDAILESDQVRAANNRGQALVVSGCLPQRFREELPKLLPEVDAFMGIDQVTQVTEIVQRALANRREKLVPAADEAKSQRQRWQESERPKAHHVSLFTLHASSPRHPRLSCRCTPAPPTSPTTPLPVSG